MRSWLYKQGSSAPKVWKKRWFVLTDYCLFYYKGAAEDQVLGNIVLPGYKVEPVVKEDKVRRKFAFKATHAGMRTYYFAAESKEMMMKWVNLLTVASLMMGRIGSPQEVEEKRERLSQDESEDKRDEDRQPNGGTPTSNGTAEINSTSSQPTESEKESPEPGGKPSSDTASDESDNRMRRVTSKAKLVHCQSAEMLVSPKIEEEASESEEVNDLKKKMRHLEAEKKALKKDMVHYRQLVESSKASLIKLKENMFQTLTSLQNDLYESQQKCEELQQRNEELEADVLRSKTVVDMADQMVLLGRTVADENEALIKQFSKASELLSATSEKAREGASQRLLEFSTKLEEEKTLQDQAFQLKEFLRKEEANLDAKLTDLGSLEDQMQDSSDIVSQLQEEKVMLEDRLASASTEKEIAGKGKSPADLEKRLEVISQRLISEEKELEEKAQENVLLESEVVELKERLNRAENINTGVAAADSANRKEELEGELVIVEEEIKSLTADKLALKREVEELRSSVLSSDVERRVLPSGSHDGVVEAPSPCVRPPQRQMSEMTRLEMSLELSAAKNQLEEVQKEKKQMATLKVKLEQETRTRSKSDASAYRAPKWVKDLELKKGRSPRLEKKSRVRDPEKLSFREKLQLFL
eukprot:m.47370 g.47370  ORF g.47370 m.47370 type:complete len:641 (+) comp33779_c1_seq6:567-2489(+)